MKLLEFYLYEKMHVINSGYLMQINSIDGEKRKNSAFL